MNIDRNKLIYNFYRSFPLTFYIIYTLISLIYFSKIFYYDILFIFILDKLNKFFKLSFKYLYLKNGTNKLTVLGIGNRPKEARYCDIFLREESKYPNDYGMPSGHSQLLWIVFTYFTLILLESEINTKIKKLLIILLFVFSIYGSYVRTAIEKCHTEQQVIIGAFLGVILGKLGFGLKKKLMK
tara:strand:+ start:387 stop:935 length:549 start_codon:yes stop_codon:yes gene_type:complete